MKRREFLQCLSGLTAGAILSRQGWPQEAPPVVASGKTCSDRVLIGPKKIELSRLAMGTGTVGWKGSSNQTRKLGTDGLAGLLKEGFNRGITFWDSADQYGSHPHLGTALDLVKREKVTIMTKSRAQTAEEMRADIERFRKEIKTGTIDILLLHCLTDGEWNKKMRPVMDVVDEYQAKGIIRSKGVSCHSLEALKTAAAEPWVEIDLARINPGGYEMDAKPEIIIPILQDMKKQGKGVIGMKIFGAGKMRDRQDEALSYVLKQDCIDCFTIGMENMNELKDTVSRIERLGKTVT